MWADGVQQQPGAADGDGDGEGGLGDAEPSASASAPRSRGSGSESGSGSGSESGSGSDGETESQRKHALARRGLLGAGELPPEEWARIGPPADVVDSHGEGAAYAFSARGYSMMTDCEWGGGVTV
jgi:hypothetical protein